MRNCELLWEYYKICDALGDFCGFADADLYRTTDSTARFLLLQSLLGLSRITTPFLVMCSKMFHSTVNSVTVIDMDKSHYTDT